MSDPSGGPGPGGRGLDPEEQLVDEADEDEDEVALGPARARRGWLRLAAFVALILALHVLVRATGLSDSLSVTSLRAAMRDAGGWGPALYVLGYCGAYLAGMPGLPLVALGVAAWGQVEGGALAFVTSLVAASCNFWVGRVIGGRLAGDRDLSRLPWRFARNQLRRLEQGPVRTIAIVRAVLVLPPVLDYVLGLTTVSYPRFLLGSAIGLLPPLLAAVLLIETLVRWFGL